MRRLVAALLLAGLTVPAGSSSGAGARLYAVVVAHPTGGATIDIRDATGRVVRSLGTGYDTRWSPDGRHLAWVDRTGVHVEAADGSGARLVASTPRTRDMCEQGCLGIENFAWSPDSRFLAVGGAGPDTRHLKVVDVGSGDSVDIVPPGSLEIVTGWTRDGDVAFMQSAGCCRWQVTLGAADRVDTRVLYRSPSRRLPVPSVSPDGRILAMAWDSTLRLIDVSSGQLRTVHVPGRLYAQSPAWSPDSRRVALARAGGPALLVDVRTGRASTLGGPALAFRWIGSGELLWVRGPDDNQQREVWSSADASSPPHLLFRVPKGTSLFSVDGR